VVRAGLEGHVERRPSGALTRSGQRGDLGVWRSAPRVPALADDLPVALHDRADDGMRVVDLLPPALRQLERPLKGHASAWTSRR
jgi:hypothetical protein